MAMFRGVATVIFSSLLITGCSKSSEEKMIAICTEVVKFSVSDPASLVVNSSSASPHPVTEQNLKRFYGLWGSDALTDDQQAALQIQIQEVSKLKEVYAEIDFTDKSAGSTRGRAVCWFMDRGMGYQLGSVSVQGKSYSGIDLTALFVDYKKPEYLGASNRLQ